MGKPFFQVEGHGAPVVLVHGSMASKEQWQPLVAQLVEKYKVITLDLLGYGMSPLPADMASYSLAEESALISSVVSATLASDETYHLVGHSYGGVVAMDHALRQSPRIRSLTLYEPMAYHLLAPDHQHLSASRQMVAAISEAIASGDAQSGAEAFIDLWMQPGTFQRLSDREKQALAEGVKKMVYDFQAAAGAPWTAEDYSHLTMPSCLITGKSSPPYSLSIAETVAKVIPGICRREIGGGHFALVTNPMEVTPVISSFLASASGC